MVTNASLHYTILKEIIEKGFAPNVEDLSRLLNVNTDIIIKGLYALQEYHGVVLHPDKPKIWVIHPFSLAPTSFYVQSAKGEWWGNCAWCSLGIATLLKEDVTITTVVGGETEQIKIHIQNGKIQETEYYIHFPIPMKQAWDNVIYTCSNMLIFENEAQVERWATKHQIPRGDLQSITKIWDFAQEWYGNHLDPNWEKWTITEARKIFQKFDLNHPIWDLGDSSERF